MSEENEISIEDVGKGEDIGVKVADWLAEKNRIPEGIVEGTVEAVTKKAVLIDDNWIPKSQVEKTWLL
ncbi:MAG: hypothetical protein ACOC85_02350 [Thermoplasmatota archaeon]